MVTAAPREDTDRAVCSLIPRHLIVSLQAARPAIQPSPPLQPPAMWTCPLAAPPGVVSLPLPTQEHFSRWDLQVSLLVTSLGADPITSGLGLTSVKGGFPCAPGKQTHWLGTLLCCQAI